MNHSYSPETKIRVFIDFDGTITEQDVGDSIFESFLPADLLADDWHGRIIAQWKAGEISSFECLTEECNRTFVSKQELNSHLDTITMRRGFDELAEYLETRNIPLMILSDGLDYYIEYLLAKRGLSHIPYRSNGIRFREDGSLEAVFPHIEHGCGLCGNCKRYHIDTLREYGETVIYAGDGYSDRFAIRSSDVVFARDDLAEYCTTHDREFIPFDDFYTIKQYIERVHT